MAEAAAPPGGWADAPRPPLTVTLDARRARLLRHRAVRATQGRPALLRVALALVLAALIASALGPWAGGGALVTLLVLGVVPLGVAVVRARTQIAPGTVRATGYDRDGSFVFLGASPLALPAGWAAGVDEHGGLVTVRPARRGVPPLVTLRELVTPEDERFLLDHAARQAASTALPRSTVVTAPLQRAVWRGLLVRMRSRPVLVLVVVLVALESALFWGLPTGWRVAAVLTPVLAVTLCVPLLLWTLTRRWLPVGRELRAGVVGGVFRLEGSRLFPGELPLEAVLAAPRGGLVSPVRAAHGGTVPVPTALLEDATR